MADSKQAERSLFFTGSDDENDGELEYLTPPGAHQSADTKPSSEPQPQTHSLFFADSEDEEKLLRISMSPMKDIRGSPFGVQDTQEEMDVDVKIPEIPTSRAPSVSSASSAQPPAPSSPASSVGPDTSIEPPRKKRKLSPPIAKDRTEFVSAYLGSFLVADAWSTVRGKGFVKVRNQLHCGMFGTCV